MIRQKSNKRNSFLLKLIRENKSLINENIESSEEDEEIKNPSNDLSLNIEKINSEEEMDQLNKNDNLPILGNAYYFSKIQDQKQSSNNDIKKVLILYTGGTIGMEKSDIGLRPQSNFLLNYMFNHSNFCDKEYTCKNSNPEKDFDLNKDFLITPETIIGRRIYYKIYEFDSIIDSSNMNLEYWRKIGRSIDKFYYKYDSFIVLHGTDTMNYTASILSFMLENLNKLVILTGSQIPLVEMRNDAQKNLIDALTIAGTYDIPEVCLLFDSKLFRGNRTIKNDNINLDAFDTPNLPPLVKIGINIKINWDLILPENIENFNYFENINNNICIIKFFPIINDETFASFFQPPIQAVIIETYGTGNLPSNRPFILEVLRNARRNGITIVNVSQCRKGLVGESSYSGNLLESLGVINAWDMTVECALAKLSYLLGKDYDSNKIKVLFQQDMRGEITIRKQELFSLYSNTYINSILNLIGLDKTNEENFTLAQSLLPTIIKSSVEKNDLRILKNMRNEISNISYQSYSKKSPMHISSKLGFYEVTDFLISCKLNINELDYNGYTPLDYACEYKHNDVARLIRENGGVLNNNVNNSKLFNQLANEGDLDTLKILHNSGANLLSVDYDGRNISHIAASEGKFFIIEYLLFELKLDIMSNDRWGNNPYSEGNNEIKELIEKRYKIEKVFNQKIRRFKKNKEKNIAKEKFLNNKKQREQN